RDGDIACCLHEFLKLPIGDRMEIYPERVDHYQVGRSLFPVVPVRAHAEYSAGYPDRVRKPIILAGSPVRHSFRLAGRHQSACTQGRLGHPCTLCRMAVFSHDNNLLTNWFGNVFDLPTAFIFSADALGRSCTYFQACSGSRAPTLITLTAQSVYLWTANDLLH